jgi:hypothetical protein
LSTVLIYCPSVSCRNSTVTYCGSTTRTPRRGNGQIFTTAVSSTTWARCSAVISSHRWRSYRALPQRFARVHRRYQTPIRSVSVPINPQERETLFVTEAAIKQHLQNLYDKFAIPPEGERRVRLANEAIRRGAVTLAILRDSGTDEE